MTSEEQATLVRRWFEKATQAGGPVLPDGWFGRPYDNIYWLVDVQQAPGALIVRLTNDTTLEFKKLARVLILNSQLVFDGYEQATLRSPHYGGGPDAPYREKQYDYGQVRLAPPVGTTVELA